MRPSIGGSLIQRGSIQVRSIPDNILFFRATGDSNEMVLQSPGQLGMANAQIRSREIAAPLPIRARELQRRPPAVSRLLK
jgi:hypothetical protein